MLAVHGQHAHAVFARFVHDNLAGHDENFLRRNGNILARANRRERGLQSCRADNRDQNNVRRRQAWRVSANLRCRKKLVSKRRAFFAIPSPSPDR